MAFGDTPSSRGTNGSSNQSLTKDFSPFAAVRAGLVAGGLSNGGALSAQPFDRSVSHRKSLPGSRKGSSSKLTTLVESQHEGVENVLASDDLVTPSLLLESHHLLSNSGELSDKDLSFDMNDSPAMLRKVDSIVAAAGGGSVLVMDGRKSPGGVALNLSHELADIRRKSIELSMKQGSVSTDLVRKGALFQIGGGGSQDSGDGSDSPSDFMRCGSVSPTQALPPGLTLTRPGVLGKSTNEPPAAGGKVRNRVGSQGALSVEGSANTEEMFSMQLEEVQWI